MKCVMCGNQLLKGEINCSRNKKGRLIVFKNVPALICKNCGEQYVDEQEITIMNKKLQEDNLFGIVNFQDLV